LDKMPDKDKKSPDWAKVHDEPTKALELLKGG
jgi:hypothetical protein